MASLAALRKQAKEMGIAASVIRSATTAEELQSVIDDNGAHDEPRRKKVTKKSAVKKNRTSAVRKSKTAKTKPVKAKRNSARKASAPATSRKSGKAKRPSTSGYQAKGGRNLLESIDWNAEGDWNPRQGSPVEAIFKALKKFKGNREKVFDALVGDVWDYVAKKSANGSKRSKADAEKMLRYRIARTAWDFAMRTGQHESADNRVEYGTGGTGRGVWKPAKATKTKTAAKTTRKAAAKKTTRKSNPKRATAHRGSQRASRASSRKSGKRKTASRR